MVDGRELRKIQFFAACSEQEIRELRISHVVNPLGARYTGTRRPFGCILHEHSCKMQVKAPRRSS